MIKRNNNNKNKKLLFTLPFISPFIMMGHSDLDEWN